MGKKLQIMKDKLKEFLDKCDKFFPKGEDFKGNHHICMPDGKLTLYVYVLERKTIFWVDMSDDEFNQGVQHYKPMGFGGDGNEKLQRTLKNDLIKFVGCVDNKIKLLYYTKEKN